MLAISISSYFVIRVFCLAIGTEAALRFPGLPWSFIQAQKEEREGQIIPTPYVLSRHESSRVSRVQPLERHAMDSITQRGRRRTGMSSSSPGPLSSSNSSQMTSLEVSNRVLFSPLPCRPSTQGQGSQTGSVVNPYWTPSPLKGSTGDIVASVSVKEEPMLNVFRSIAPGTSSKFQVPH